MQSVFCFGFCFFPKSFLLPRIKIEGKTLNVYRSLLFTGKMVLENNVLVKQCLLCMTGLMHCKFCYNLKFHVADSVSFPTVPYYSLFFFNNKKNNQDRLRCCSDCT